MATIVYDAIVVEVDGWRGARVGGVALACRGSVAQAAWRALPRTYHDLRIRQRRRRELGDRTRETCGALVLIVTVRAGAQVRSLDPLLG